MFQIIIQRWLARLSFQTNKYILATSQGHSGQKQNWQWVCFWCRLKVSFKERGSSRSRKMEKINLYLLTQDCWVKLNVYFEFKEKDQNQLLLALFFSKVWLKSILRKVSSSKMADGCLPFNALLNALKWIQKCFNLGFIILHASIAFSLPLWLTHLVTYFLFYSGLLWETWCKVSQVNRVIAKSEHPWLAFFKDILIGVTLNLLNMTCLLTIDKLFIFSKKDFVKWLIGSNKVTRPTLPSCSKEDKGSTLYYFALLLKLFSHFGFHCLSIFSCHKASMTSSLSSSLSSSSCQKH